MSSFPSKSGVNWSKLCRSSSARLSIPSNRYRINRLFCSGFWHSDHQDARDHRLDRRWEGCPGVRLDGEVREVHGGVEQDHQANHPGTFMGRGVTLFLQKEQSRKLERNSALADIELWRSRSATLSTLYQQLVREMTCMLILF
jgi:hypothetical protein